MSFYSGFVFFMYLIIALIPAIILGLAGKSLKYYRYLLSVFFISYVFYETPLQLVYLVGYAVFSTALVKTYLVYRKKLGRNGKIYGLAVFLALLPLIISKIGGFFGSGIFAFLGISYLCFRVLQVIIETYDGVIEDIEARQLLSFLFFFPALSSGPIDRSRRFAGDDAKIYSRAEYLDLLSTGLFKLLLGAFYKIVCSAIFYKLLTAVFADRFKPQYLVGYAYVYGFYLFFDFAGYSAMAVGTSYILGIKMPDNFNKPFLSVDFKDFWNRWHITLSWWFRDFLFTRFIMDSARKKRFRNRLTGVVAGLLLNMTIMGIWHGLEAHYIAYGVYHGLILGLTEIYQKKSQYYKSHKNGRCYKLVSWFLTINLAMFGFLIFSGHLQLVFEKIRLRF